MSESPGTLIGLSNVVTRLRGRVAPGPDPDGTPGLRERLRTNALRALEGPESFIHDAILLGRRVRLFSNSHHLADFWRDHWPTEGEWKAATGQPVARDPDLTLYAMIGVAAEPEASYLSSGRPEAWLFNTSYYGDLRVLAAEALGLRAGPGAQVLHGGAVEVNGRLLVLLYPKDLVHPTPVWGLMELPGARLLAEGWLAVDAEGRAHALERRLYVRTSVLESYPGHAARFLGCKFENVPDPAAAPAAAGEILEASLRGDPRSALRGLPPEIARDMLLRLTSSADSRALVDPAQVFGRTRVARGPMETAAVFRLTARKGEAIRPIPLEPFSFPAYEVSVPSVPGHPRELARLIAAR